MAFGLNRVELIGRLGTDVTVNHLTSGGRGANLSVATDESYINKQTGDRFSTEILLVPGGRVQFLDRPNGANGNGAATDAGQAPANGSSMPAGGAPAQTADMDDDIPF